MINAFASGVHPDAAIARPSTAPEITARERLCFPLAEVSSEAATHAPRASFQMLLYDLFICSTQFTVFLARYRLNRKRDVPGSEFVAKATFYAALNYKNAGMYLDVYIHGATQHSRGLV
jgi:hypothetical protein